MNIFRFPNICSNIRVEAVLNELQKFGCSKRYEELVLKIISVNRTPPEQHFIISTMVLFKGIGSYGVFQEYDAKAPVDKKVWIPQIGKELYTWQRAWSRLLQMGNIVFPPLDADALEPFQLCIDGIDRKSCAVEKRMVTQSNHCKGLAFDIKEDSGDRPKVLDFLRDAKKSGIPIQNWYAEREYIIHVNI